MNGYEVLEEEDKKLVDVSLNKKAEKRKLDDHAQNIKGEKIYIKKEANDENEDPVMKKIKIERLEKEKHLKVKAFM